MAASLRRDPISGRLVAIAPGRADRPGAGRALIQPETQEERDACPFCEGREHRTPPEVFSYDRYERAPDTPGWALRIVPNLYPAVERQEVVVHTPHHTRSLADLEGRQVANIAGAWSARAQAAREEGFAYVQAIVNEGRAAGSSLPHSHSQLAWLRGQPAAAASERTTSGDCGVCELLASADELGLGEANGSVVALLHPAGRLPYEVLVAPVEHEPEPWGVLLEAALDLMVGALRRIRASEGEVPFNAWLHCAAFGGDGHWHLELVPRLTVLAGLELGAGIYVNSLDPAEAVRRLREV